MVWWGDLSCSPAPSPEICVWPRIFQQVSLFGLPLFLDLGGDVPVPLYSRPPQCLQLAFNRPRAGTWMATQKSKSKVCPLLLSDNQSLDHRCLGLMRIRGVGEVGGGWDEPHGGTASPLLSSEQSEVEMKDATLPPSLYCCHVRRGAEDLPASPPPCHLLLIAF